MMDVLGKVAIVPTHVATAVSGSDYARQNWHIEKDAQDATLVGLGIQLIGVGVMSSHMARCLAIHSAYKHLKCLTCHKGCMTCSSVRTKLACFSALAAGRGAFIKNKCDYVWYGSQRRGVKKAVKGHNDALKYALGGVTNCKVALLKCIK